MITDKDIIRFYEFFYKEKYGNEGYRFKPSIKADHTIQNFLSNLNDRYNIHLIGTHFLSRYFSFQFRRVENQVFKRFAGRDEGGKIQIYDIVGRKAFDYFEKRDVKFDYIIETPLPISREKKGFVEASTDRYEEIEKKRFLNTSRGLLNCIDRTSLFNHKSSYCILCENKVSCKELLKKNYKAIYDNRGYDKATK